MQLAPSYKDRILETTKFQTGDEMITLGGIDEPDEFNIFNGVSAIRYPEGFEGLGDFWSDVGSSIQSVASQAGQIATAFAPKPIQILPSATGYGQGQIYPYSQYPAMANPALYNPNTALPYGITPSYQQSAYQYPQQPSFFSGNMPLILLGGGALVLVALMASKG